MRRHLGKPWRGHDSVLVLFASDSQFLHSGLQGSALHSQTCRRPAQAGDNSSGFPQDAEDMLPLQIFQS